MEQRKEIEIQADMHQYWRGMMETSINLLIETSREHEKKAKGDGIKFLDSVWNKEWSAELKNKLVEVVEQYDTPYELKLV